MKRSVRFLRGIPGSGSAEDEPPGLLQPGAANKEGSSGQKAAATREKRRIELLSPATHDWEWIREGQEPEGVRSVTGASLKRFHVIRDRNTAAEVMVGRGEMIKYAGIEPPSPWPERTADSTHGRAADDDSPASVKGRRPAAFTLDGARYEVKSWRNLLPSLCTHLRTEGGPRFTERIARLSYFRSSVPDYGDWIAIPGTGLYVYVNITGDMAIQRARRVLQAVRGTDDGFRIELSDSTDRMEPASSAAEPELASFTGRSPAAFWLDGSRHEVARWRAVLQGVCGLMAADSGLGFGDRVAHLRGRTRPYFSREPGDLFRAVSIEGSDWFVEGNLSANDCVRLAQRTLRAVRGSDNGFRIELAE